MLVWPHMTFNALLGVGLRSYYLCASQIAPITSLSITSPDVWADIIAPFECKLVWTDEAAVTVHISPSLGLVVYPYTCIIISRKQWKCETAGGTNAIQGNKARAEWKDPGRWHSHLASIKEHNKQSRFWTQLGPVCLFILKQICMLEGMQGSIDVSIRVTWREHELQKRPSHWDVLELSPPISLCLSLYVPLSLSHIVALLCSFASRPFSYAAQGPPVRAFPRLLN